MSIYSRYSKVVESDGTTLRIRTALQLINRALDEALAEQEGEYDAETRWAVAWFEQYAMEAGGYGVAETLSKAKNTSVQSLVDAGFLEAKAGKVRLLKREELADNWNPKTARLTVCERKGWAQEALAYNSLVTSWSEISRLAHREASDSGLWEGAYLG